VSVIINVAVGSKANMASRPRHIRFTPIADSASAAEHVGQVPQAEVKEMPTKLMAAAPDVARGTFFNSKILESELAIPIVEWPTAT
jgi:hypothetical protein